MVFVWSFEQREYLPSPRGLGEGVALLALPRQLGTAYRPRTLKAIRRCPLPLAALPPAGHSSRNIRR